MTSRGTRCAVVLALLTWALPSVGCTIVRERVGNPIPERADLDLRIGETTLRDALRQLGAPDRILPQGDAIRLVYARRRRDARALRLNYQVQLLAVTDADALDTLLWLDFDASDRLTSVVWPRS